MPDPSTDQQPVSEERRIEARDVHIAALEADLADAEEALQRSQEARRELRDALGAAEEYAKEGWAWLEDALDALGAKTVFDIKAAAKERDRLAAEVSRLKGTLLQIAAEGWGQGDVWYGNVARAALVPTDGEDE